MLDAKQRRFTLTHPLHVDQYGGVIKIVAIDSPYTLKGVRMPILGYRWQTGTLGAEEHHYTLGGRWDMAGNVSGYDLWDADLGTVKPMVGQLTVYAPSYHEEPVTTNDDYLSMAEELAQQEEDEAVEDDTEDYEGDPDAPMGGSRYTGRNI